MTPQQRDATIQHFMNNPGVTVFLISLKAGGVALVSSSSFTLDNIDEKVISLCKLESHRSLDGVHDGFMVEPFGGVPSYGQNSSTGSEKASQGRQAYR